MRTNLHLDTVHSKQQYKAPPLTGAYHERRSGSEGEHCNTHHPNGSVCRGKGRRGHVAVETPRKGTRLVHAQPRGVQGGGSTSPHGHIHPGHTQVRLTVRAVVHSCRVHPLFVGDEVCHKGPEQPPVPGLGGQTARVGCKVPAALCLGRQLQVAIGRYVPASHRGSRGEVQTGKQQRVRMGVNLHQAHS